MEVTFLLTLKSTVCEGMDILGLIHKDGGIY